MIGSVVVEIYTKLMRVLAGKDAGCGITSMTSLGRQTERERRNRCQDTKRRNNHPISNVGNVSLSPRDSLAEYTASSLS